MFPIITNTLEPVSYFIYFLAFLFHCLVTKKWNESIAIVFYLFSALIMFYAAYLAVQHQQNTLIYNYCLLPGSILFFSWYFGINLHSDTNRKIVFLIFFLNLLLIFFRVIVYGKVNMFDSIGFATLSLSVLVMCFMFFRQSIQEVSEKPLFANFNFWIVCSYLIYFSGSFLVLLTYYYLTEKISIAYVHKNRYLLTLLWVIPNILLFTGSLFALTGALWTNYHKRS